MGGLKDQLLNLSKKKKHEKTLLFAYTLGKGKNFVFELNTMQDINQNMCKTTVKSQHGKFLRKNPAWNPPPPHPPVIKKNNSCSDITVALYSANP